MEKSEKFQDWIDLCLNAYSSLPGGQDVFSLLETLESESLSLVTQPNGHFYFITMPYPKIRVELCKFFLDMKICVDGCFSCYSYPIQTC